MESFLDHPDNLRIIPFVPGDYIGYSRILSDPVEERDVWMYGHDSKLLIIV